METNEMEKLSLEEVIAAFVQIGAREDRMECNKEVDALKAAFYKELVRLKAEAALAGGNPEEQPYAEIEHRFKTMLSDYKNERSGYLAAQEARRQLNLERKKAVVEELKALVDGPLDDINLAFPKLRELQASWRETGPVPASEFRQLNDTYQFLVEKFYDMVKINHDLRDLDFKKNLEAKESLCAQAENLDGVEDVVAAFGELQKLHEQWKEYGPVDKEHREAIWERFKAATASINRKYQDHFEQIKARQEENLAVKTAMCEELEAIAGREEDYTTPSAWAAASKQIEDIQARWRKTGFASRKDNQKIYDRMRAACDAFFGKKKAYFNSMKDEQAANEAAKLSLIEQAEALVGSTEWKQTTEQFLSLQAQWKKTGPVNHKKSDELWKRFRAACDAFFEQRDKNAKPENNFYANLKAKKAVIAQIEAWEGEDKAAALAGFTEQFNAIGFVPFKEKDNIQKAFKDAVRAKFPEVKPARSQKPERKSDPRQELVAKYRALQQDITTSENNLGFFKAGSALLDQMQQNIDKAKEELRQLEERIRQIDGQEEE